MNKDKDAFALSEVLEYPAEAETADDDNQKSPGLVDTFLTLMEQYLPALAILFFIIGIVGARQSRAFAYSVNNLMDGFIASYGYIAPLAIYCILTPSVIKLFSLSQTRGKSFANYAIRWFVKARIVACLFAAVATAVIFRFPLYVGGSGFFEAVAESLQSLLWMVTHSSYFYAFYASIITIVISLKYARLAHMLVKGVDLIEYAGRIIVPFIPLFMLAVGAYITILPEIIETELGVEVHEAHLGIITFLGLSFDMSTSWGMIAMYVVGSLITAVVCGIWHGGLIVLAKMKMPDFSLRKYVRTYWIKVYPLLWATSSEALATPLNLYLVKKLCPDIRDEVRQFVVGTGSFLNINGTMINVFLMTGLVAKMVGIEISLLQLILSIPVVFLIGYGVPGIPGELLLFGGPMVICMGIDQQLSPVFLSLYLGLQIGLPDSFRTVANSTDECLCAIILDKKY